MISAGIALLAASTCVFNAEDLSRAMSSCSTNVPFRIEATVLCDSWTRYAYFAVSDQTSAVLIRKPDGMRDDLIRGGNRLRICGVTAPGKRRFAVADCLSTELIASGTPPLPEQSSLAEFNRGTCDSKYVRLRGTVRDTFRDELTKSWIYLTLTDKGDAAYAAFKPSDPDASDFMYLVGCEIEITGICNPDEGGARHHLGRMLIAPGDSAIVILRKPPWWTPARLIFVIIILILTLGAALVWDFALHRVAERRSRELLKEQLAHIKSELKIAERMRLAVELHDTLSQNLIGAALEINTAEQLVLDDGKSALLHLHIASKTLKSCRDELRNCLWDLRSEALEVGDMNEAIRKTLAPYIEDVDLQVRFNVPRKLFTDNTAHVLMRIIRELVLNAIRHGRAKTIRIAGSRENGHLHFSVRDDGCGFDSATVPGVGQGHFGLQGIRERLRLLKGTIDIDSSSGAGTYVSAHFQLPTDEAEKI